MNIESRVTRRSCPAVITVACAALLLAGCNAGVLDPQGPVGKAESLILLDATVIMLAVVIPVIVMTFAFAWWFRSGNTRARYRPDWAFSGKLELIVWSIPTLLILFLGGIAWVSSHDLAPEKPLVSDVKPVTVQVVSLDWKWLFIYPEEGVATVNQLVIPVGTPIQFELTSATVFNSFFIPQLGSQIYTMFGMTTRLNLMADNPGTFQGLSANFSGDGFSDMRFDVKSVSKDGYAEWLAAMHGKGKALDTAAFRELSKATIDEPPSSYRSVDGDLFRRIVDGTAATASGAHEDAQGKASESSAQPGAMSRETPHEHPHDPMPAADHAAHPEN